MKAELPEAFVTQGDSIELIITATEIIQCNDLQALIEAMEQNLSTDSLPKASERSVAWSSITRLPNPS